MNLKLDSIKWPENHRDANILLKSLYIKILTNIDMDFSGLKQDPRELVEKYIAFSATAKELSACENIYKSLLVDEGFARDFRNHRAIEIRLATIVVSIDDDNPHNLGEQLSWFIELLGYRGEDEAAVVDIVIDHFDGHIQT
jgi:hypothetical protein